LNSTACAVSAPPPCPINRHRSAATTLIVCFTPVTLMLSSCPCPVQAESIVARGTKRHHHICDIFINYFSRDGGIPKQRHHAGPPPQPDCLLPRAMLPAPLAGTNSHIISILPYNQAKTGNEGRVWLIQLFLYGQACRPFVAERIFCAVPNFGGRPVMNVIREKGASVDVPPFPAKETLWNTRPL